MKISQILGSIFVLSAVVFVSFASDSTLTDKAAGKAINIVETNNVIHVYTYTGVSSEATFLSTFDEGESWTEAPVVPAKSVPSTRSALPLKQKSETRYSRSNRNSAVPVQSEYIKAIDSCIDSGKQWDFRTDDCVELY
jgi:hypothetical protein